MYKQLKLTLRNLDNDDKLYLKFNINQTKIAQKWAYSLHTDYLVKDTWLRKDYVLHGWDFSNHTHSRNKHWLCKELNWHINYLDDIFVSKNINYHIGMHFNGDTVDQNQLNEIHRHFETILEHNDVKMSETKIWKYLSEADRFSVLQLNTLCHETESRLMIDRMNSNGDNSPHSAMIVCIYPGIKRPLVLEDGDYDEFRLENLTFGSIRMHFPQTGKQPHEAFMHGDEIVPGHELEPIKFLSGEFDLNFAKTYINWDNFIEWCHQKGINTNDKRMALGYCILANIDKTDFGDKTDNQIHDIIMNYNDLFCITLIDHKDNVVATKEYTEPWYEQYSNIFLEKYGIKRDLFPQ